MKIQSIILFLVVLLTSCGGEGNKTDNTNQQLSGTIKIDGSSTVYPITAGVAEYFAEYFSNVEVLIGVSGTGGGFKKFALGETDINNSSRIINEKEVRSCLENEIKYEKLKIAYDGIAVVINKENDWVDYLTTEELKKIWIDAKNNAKTWGDVREGWPNEPITLYGPGVSSGTFDSFNETIIGVANNSRTDYNSSENDNVLVKGIYDEKNALGYFGLAYYEENKDKLKIVPINNGQGNITPNLETIRNESYLLSHPIFIYFNTNSIKKPEVSKFLEFYQEKALEISTEVGYVPLTKEETITQKEKLKVILNHSK